MQDLLSPGQGISFLLLYGALMLSLTWFFGRGRKRTKVEFLLASRRVSVLPGALSIAASWIWAPALFLAAQKAYEQGVAGLFWFVTPNALCLMVFAPLAFRIRKILPAGYTLPQFIRAKHGRGTHLLYLIQFFGLQICSFAVQILAGASLIQLMTGLSFYAVALVLVIIALTYSLMGGLRASVITDFVQMTLIFGIAAVTIPWAVSSAGGWSAVQAGFGGITGEFRNVFDPWIAYSFGIPVTIGLLSGPIGDQMHWQRAYALHSDRGVIRTFILGSFLFALVPLSLSLLGFVAANPAVSGQWIVESNQLIGPTTVANLLPHSMLLVFSVMLLSGLCSTLDSILSAVSSLATVDVFRRHADDGSEEQDRGSVSIARGSMLLTALLGLCVSFIPGLQILHLFLFYGTLRASTMIPTVLSLFWDQLNSRAVFAAILCSLLFGAPLYAAGAFFKSPHLSVTGSLLVVIIGFSVCTIGTFLFPRSERAALRM